MTAWILMESFPSEIEASVLQGQLQAAGIECRLRLNPMGDALLGSFGVQNGPTDVFVKREDATKAQNIIIGHS